MIILKDLEDAINERKEGRNQGWLLGGLDFLGTVLGFGAACGLGSEFTFGLSCAGWLLTVSAGGIGSYLGFDKAADAKREQQGFEESASDKFREIP